MKQLAAAGLLAALATGCATSTVPIPRAYYEHTSCTTLEYQLRHFERGNERINAHFDERARVFDDGTEGMRRSTLARYAEHRKAIEAEHARRCA